MAHRNDQLLIAAGVKKRCLKLMNKLGLTNSYKTALLKNKQLATNHDTQVKEWKKQIEENKDNKPEYQV